MMVARIVTLLAMLLGFVVPAAAAVTESLTPAVGPPSTKTVVGIAGFPATTPVDIYFDATDFCLVITDVNGAASCTITVPAAATPQAHFVTALQRGGATAIQKPFTVRTNWTQGRGLNSHNTGFNTFENTINPGNASRLDVRWEQQNAGEIFYTSPVVSGGIVYAISSFLNPRLFAYNAVNGAPVAGYPVAITGSPGSSSPAINGSSLFYAYVNSATGEGFLAGINVNTRANLAGYPKSIGVCSATNVTASPPTIAAGAVYVGCGPNLYAFDVTTGAAKPNFPVIIPGTRFTIQPAVSGQNLLALSDSGTVALELVRIDTGAVTQGSGTLFMSPPMVFGNIDGIEAYADGNTLFSHSIPPNPPTDLVITTSDSQNIESVSSASGRYYVFDLGGTVTAYSASTGETAWTKFVGGGKSWPGMSVVANGVLYLPIRTKIVMLAEQDGSLLGDIPASTNYYGGPVISDGSLYVASAKGSVLAYSVNGLAPSANLPGGAAGVRPAISALKPDYRLRPVTASQSTDFAH